MDEGQVIAMVTRAFGIPANETRSLRQFEPSASDFVDFSRQAEEQAADNEIAQKIKAALLWPRD
jgi:hypothetical protein